MSAVWYVYPMWQRVSFTLVAQQHLAVLRKRLRVEEVDELAFPHIFPHSRPVVVVHPYFYCMVRASRFISRKLHYYGALIGVDVADSDHISNLAVSMTHYAYCMVVPSSFAKKVYERSGVTVPIHVVPHGLPHSWYEQPNTAGNYFKDLLKLKHEKKLKLILFFLWHSPYRKGWDLVIEWYKRLKSERKDVVLVLKTGTANGPEAQEARRLGCIHVYGWLTEAQKMELYDLADLYPLFSRGGGFEMNGLEALARLVPTLAARGGSWEDYMPDWLLVDSKPCPRVLRDNPIHDGKGVEIDIEKAVDKAHTILDNLDDHKAKLAEWREKRLKHTFTWENAGNTLYEIIRTALEHAKR